MRSCDIDFKKIEQVEVIKKAVNKILSPVTKDVIKKVITADIIYLDYENNEISGERIIIDGNYYDLIMSENPDFAPGKPINDYREDDLWYVIDLIKNNQ